MFKYEFLLSDEEINGPTIQLTEAVVSRCSVKKMFLKKRLWHKCLPVNFKLPILNCDNEALIVTLGAGLS